MRYAIYWTTGWTGRKLGENKRDDGAIDVSGRPGNRAEWCLVGYGGFGLGGLAYCDFASHDTPPLTEIAELLLWNALSSTACACFIDSSRWEAW